MESTVLSHSSLESASKSAPSLSRNILRPRSVLISIPNCCKLLF
nr:MAG TPA: hypothetical protein [Caudoviricetes sp.]DAR22371.1 MAG TPA: hypothetical protein [Caudoviricetes sp.]